MVMVVKAVAKVARVALGMVEALVVKAMKEMVAL